MKKLLMLLAVTGLTAMSGAIIPSAMAQTAATSTDAAQADKNITPNFVIAEVTSINSTEKTMSVKTDAGSAVTVSFADKTTYKRLSPGETTLAKAAEITLAEVAVGDRVLARGKVSEDRKSVPAGMIVVMTKADIAQKQERDRAEWQRRGVVGTISAINPATKEVTIATRAREAANQGGVQVALEVVLEASENVRFRRYAPDSVKFSDAKPSSFAELKVGDQIRALGEKSPDGAKLKSEEIVSGAFRTLGGTVTAINPETSELKVKDLMAGREFTVSVNKDSLLRRLPPQAAEMIAQRAVGSGGPEGGGGGGRRMGRPASGGPGGGPPPGGEQRPMGGPGGGGPGAGGPGPRGGFDLQEMLERMPQITLAELKPGDVVLFSSTVGNDPMRATAITMIAGLDPLVKMMQASPRGNAGSASAGPGGNLPGLDIGIGLP